MNTHLMTPRPTEQPPQMRFQARDEEILSAIYRYGGVLAKRQLKELFWPDKSSRAMEKRLAKLYRGGFLDWPSHDQWRVHPVSEPICWLGWRGALLLARDSDTNIQSLHAENENRQRKLEQNLRKSSFHWLREPRWLQLKHDLRVVDFRMIVERAIRQHPSLKLRDWVLEREFRSNPDVIEYEVRQVSGAPKRVRKAVIPDGFFSIENTRRLIGGQPYTARFLLEMDMSTEDNPRFGREKLSPSIAYLRSSQYQERFGYKSGRWLVIANSIQRLQNLMQQAELTLGADSAIFYFTTFDKLDPTTALSAPIWFRGGDKSERPLLEI